MGDLSASSTSNSGKNRPRRTRSHELASSTNSNASSGSARRGTRPRMGSHNQKHAPACMHPSDMIAMLEQRASLTGDMKGAADLFEQIKLGTTTPDFEPDSDTEA